MIRSIICSKHVQIQIIFFSIQPITCRHIDWIKLKVTWVRYMHMQHGTNEKAEKFPTFCREDKLEIDSDS
jgi:hypothetical protein